MKMGCCFTKKKSRAESADATSQKMVSSEEFEEMYSKYFRLDPPKYEEEAFT